MRSSGASPFSLASPQLNSILSLPLAKNKIKYFLSNFQTIRKKHIVSSSFHMLQALMNPCSLTKFNVRVLIFSHRRLSTALPFLNSKTNNLHSHHPEPTEPLTKTQLKTLVLNQYTRNGKFSNLVRNIVASPTVLLTACRNLALPGPHETNSKPSLFDSISENFSVHEMGRELRENRFSLEACCVTLVPSRKKAASLVLPNLKLKVLIEAIRMVLEVIYDKRFMTFAYGGRVGMGRHTAIRYLKGSVMNPNWWFTVTFDLQKFDSRYVSHLCLIIEEKIDDGYFIELMKMLFASKAVSIELGGCSLARGFPQESSLCSILINIYFNGLDKEIHDMRLQVSKDNPQIASGDVSTSNVFYKPVKMHAVRYLDEIMVIISGSKMMTMDLKNKILKYIEGKLELKVNKVKTVIHSAVSEKVEFLGMELQAVPPSVLHPPMSEKAIRARKKYLRQKEVNALELRNARERNRKKLGLKILDHVFKKLKRGGEFKNSDIQIENEVREIFGTWADEVVEEFFKSLEDRYNWHRMLSAGNFLSLHHIRDQLPQELVDAFDNFQEQLDKHLSPVASMKALEEEERRKEEEHEQRYAERTIHDLAKLCIKVDAPIKLVRKAAKMAGFTNNMGRPRPIELLIGLDDADIIKWYAGVGRRWLEYFCCCHNFKMVKIIVSYHLRFSCILTLAEKHESTKLETIKHYTKDLKVFDKGDTEVVYFPTEKEIKMMGDMNLSDPRPVDGALTVALIRLAYEDDTSYSCAAHFCGRFDDTVLYQIRLLQNQLNVDPLNEEKWVSGMGAIHEGVNRKCLPLCPHHRDDLFVGKITLQDMDLTSCLNVN